MHNEEVGARVKGLRHRDNVTQGDLSAALSISLRHLGHIEAGTRNLTVDNAIALAEHFSVSLDYIYRGKAQSAEMPPMNQLVYETLEIISNADIRDFYDGTIINLSHLTMNM